MIPNPLVKKVGVSKFCTTLYSLCIYLFKSCCFFMVGGGWGITNLGGGSKNSIAYFYI